MIEPGTRAEVIAPPNAVMTVHVGAIVTVGFHSMHYDAYWCEVPGLGFPQMFKEAELKTILDGDVAEPRKLLT